MKSFPFLSLTSFYFSFSFIPPGIWNFYFQKWLMMCNESIFGSLDLRQGILSDCRANLFQ